MSSEVTRFSHGINVYNHSAFLKLQEAGQIAKEIRDKVVESAQEGITTQELEDLAESLILKQNTTPLFKGYDGFPYCTCISVNERVVHGFPSDYKLQNGDFLSIDLGLRHKGYCADTARPVIVGEGSFDQEIMYEVSKAACEAGIRQAFPGNTTGDIGYAIHQTISKVPDHENGLPCKFKTPLDLKGHGIGLNLHEKPDVFNFGCPGKGVRLVEGMCICIEPIVLFSSSKLHTYVERGCKQVITLDKKDSAQYENQIFISKDGPIVLT
jgi:methionyl aminopeptidase